MTLLHFGLVLLGIFEASIGLCIIIQKLNRGKAPTLLDCFILVNGVALFVLSSAWLMRQ